MSLATDRQDIADLLNALDGISATPYQPKAYGPGVAWPLLEELTQDAEVPGFLVVWRVAIVLSGDVRTAAKWIDDNHEAVAEALEDFAYVFRIQPGTIATDSGDMNAVVFSMRKEA